MSFSQTLENEVPQICIDTFKDFLNLECKVEPRACSPNNELWGIVINVTSDKAETNYCVGIQYELKKGVDVLSLLKRKYPQIEKMETPEIDVTDFLGELINIFCGKLNLLLKDQIKNAHVAQPRFVEDLNTELEINKLLDFNIETNHIPFRIYLALRN